MMGAGHRRRNSALLTLTVAIVLAVYLFPFYWMVLASLKTQIQNFAFPPLFLFAPTLDNYRSVFVNNPFALYLWNSVLIGAASTLLAQLGAGHRGTLAVYAVLMAGTAVTAIVCHAVSAAAGWW